MLKTETHFNKKNASNLMDSNRASSTSYNSVGQPYKMARLDVNPSVHLVVDIRPQEYIHIDCQHTLHIHLPRLEPVAIVSPNVSCE